MVVKIIYSIAGLASVITFALCIISGISFFTSLVRTAVVFLGVLFIFFVASNILKFGILLTTKKQKDEEKK